MKNSGSGPSMQIRIKVLKVFSDSDDLPSVLICFIRESICSTLAFDTGSENNSSTSNKTRFHKPRRLGFVSNNTIFGISWQ